MREYQGANIHCLPLSSDIDWSFCALAQPGLTSPHTTLKDLQGLVVIAGLLRQSSESLAGHIEVIETTGFKLDEVGPDTLARRCGRRSTARSFDAVTRIWRREFIRTTVERNLPQLGIGASAPTLYRLRSMLAYHHGQTWNAAAPRAERRGRALRWSRSCASPSLTKPASGPSRVAPKSTC